MCRFLLILEAVIMLIYDDLFAWEGWGGRLRLDLPQTTRVYHGPSACVTRPSICRRTCTVFP